MTERKILKMLSTLVSLMLIAAMAFSFSACDKNQTLSDLNSSDVQLTDAKSIGEGQSQFSLKVTYKDGKSEYFSVKTDEITVGEALQKLNLIEGDEGEFGLYIKKVNGVVADYDIDQTYWAFYVDGKYAVSGIDQTEINEDKEYELRVDK